LKKGDVIVNKPLIYMSKIICFDQGLLVGISKQPSKLSKLSHLTDEKSDQSQFGLGFD